jgi:hypothetical protein
VAHNKVDNAARRSIMKGAAMSAALGGLNALLPHPLYAAISRPETTKAALGFIALTDSAPLIIAQEHIMKFWRDNASYPDICFDVHRVSSSPSSATPDAASPRCSTSSPV